MWLRLQSRWFHENYEDIVEVVKTTVLALIVLLLLYWVF